MYLSLFSRKMQTKNYNLFTKSIDLIINNYLVLIIEIYNWKGKIIVPAIQRHEALFRNIDLYLKEIRGERKYFGRPQV